MKQSLMIIFLEQLAMPVKEFSQERHSVAKAPHAPQLTKY